jgi:hypothetical protein
MIGLPSGDETDDCHHREADGQQEPSEDVFTAERQCRADEGGDQPDPPLDLGIVVPHPSEKLPVSFAPTLPEVHFEQCARREATFHVSRVGQSKVTSSLLQDALNPIDVTRRASSGAAVPNTEHDPSPGGPRITRITAGPWPRR